MSKTGHLHQYHHHEMDARIKELDRYRITYFLQNPHASKTDYEREIKEKLNSLLQEIPIRITRNSSTYYYLEGRIRNVCIEYDPRAEELLDRCTRADSQQVEAWLELGACAWKKPDMAKALTCFQRAVHELKKGGHAHDPPDSRMLAKALCLLSAAYRMQLSSLPGRREKIAKLQEALKLCQEALKLRDGYAFGHYSLGNTLLARFFLIGQLQEKDLTQAIDAYQKALTYGIDANAHSASLLSHPDLTSQFINADLHINHGVALQYSQQYSLAVEQFRRALEIEPHFPVPGDHLRSLESYLLNVHEALRKPKIQQRRWRDICKGLGSEKTKRWSSQHDILHLRVVGVEELMSKGAEDSEGFALLVGVLAQVSTEVEIPRTLITTDQEGRSISICVYNFSPKFSTLIGDQLLVPKPKLILVKMGSIGEGIEFSTVRVTDPCEVIKNGKRVDVSCRAYTEMSIGAGDE